MGRTRGSGRPPLRHSSYWPQVRGRRRIAPIAIAACAACGSPITTARSTALRRYIARTGPTPDAVDLEALCQRIEQVAPYDQVEFVHLSWPIRNRDGLLGGACEAASSLTQASDRPVDPNDPKSPEVARFFVLDRPRIEPKAGPDSRRDPRWSKGTC